MGHGMIPSDAKLALKHAVTVSLILSTSLCAGGSVRGGSGGAGMALADKTRGGGAFHSGKYPGKWMTQLRLRGGGFGGGGGFEEFEQEVQVHDMLGGGDSGVDPVDELSSQEDYSAQERDGTPPISIDVEEQMAEEKRGTFEPDDKTTHHGHKDIEGKEGGKRRSDADTEARLFDEKLIDDVMPWSRHNIPSHCKDLHRQYLEDLNMECNRDDIDVEALKAEMGVAGSVKTTLKSVGKNISGPSMSTLPRGCITSFRGQDQDDSDDDGAYAAWDSGDKGSVFKWDEDMDESRAALLAEGMQEVSLGGGQPRGSSCEGSSDDHNDVDDGIEGLGGGKTWGAGHLDARKWQDAIAQTSTAPIISGSAAPAVSSAAAAVPSVPKASWTPGPPFYVGDRVACTLAPGEDEWFGVVDAVLPAQGGGAGGYRVRDLRDSKVVSGRKMRRVKEAAMSSDVERPPGPVPWEVDAEVEEVTINPLAEKWCEKFAGKPVVNEDAGLSLEERMARKMDRMALFGDEAFTNIGEGDLQGVGGQAVFRCDY